MRRLRDRSYRARRTLVERAFDWRHGIATAGDRAARDYPSGSGHDAVAYVGTQPRQLRHIIARLAIDPSCFTFVDLGAGKGRTLVVALELGFRDVVGVELSPTLAATAKHNVAAYAAHRGRKGSVRIVAADAASFPIPTEATLLYLFNPFGETTMTAVLSNVQQALAGRCERLLIAYLRPHHESLLASAPFLSLIARDHPRSVGPFSLYEAELTPPHQ